MWVSIGAIGVPLVTMRFNTIAHGLKAPGWLQHRPGCPTGHTYLTPDLVIRVPHSKMQIREGSRSSPSADFLTSTG